MDGVFEKTLKDSVSREEIEDLSMKALRYCISIVHDEQDARDALQNAWMQAIRYYGRFEEKAKFSSWFYTIVRNEAFTVLRRRPKVLFYPIEDSLDKESLTTDPNDVILLKQVEKKACSTLDELSLDLLASYVEGENCEEKFGLTVLGRKSRINRIRKKLRAAVKWDSNHGSCDTTCR